GTAIADVITGRLNPAGRLPITFYRGLEDLPPQNDYAVEKGRTYMYFEKQVSFPFGHGLSYTSFAYSNLRVAPPAPGAADKTLVVSVDVANTGSLDGDEVVQLYIHKGREGTTRPIKQLKGFTRLTIAAGKTATATIRVPFADLAYWDETTSK